MEKLTLTKKEACAKIGISRPTLDKLIRDDKSFPTFKIRKRVFISAAGLEQWILEQAQK